MSRLHGTAHPAFFPVREVLADHLASGADVGLGFCCYHRGDVVTDLWGGHADGARHSEWAPSTLLPLTSITKALLSVTLLKLAELGELDVNAPVCAYWPGFGDHVKATITVADVMSHQAGIPAFPDPITLADEIEWLPVVRKIEALTPLWTPGRAHGYHAIVLGFIACELLRRTTGAVPSATVRQLVIDPLGIDLHMTLGRDGIARLAEVLPPEGDERPPSMVPSALRGYVTGFADQSSLLHRATFGSTAMTFTDMNNAKYHNIERPTAYGTARAVAALFAALVSDPAHGRLLDAQTVRFAGAERSSGVDEVFQVPTRWGFGFMLPGGPLWPGFGRPAFGHIGSTGALAFADPQREFAFAFLPNKMKSVYEVPDRRAQTLIRICYAALDRMRQSRQ